MDIAYDNAVHLYETYCGFYEFAGKHFSEFKNRYHATWKVIINVDKIHLLQALEMGFNKYHIK